MSEVMLRRRTLLLGGVAGLGALALAGCGGDDADTTRPSSGEPPEENARGEVTVAPDGTQEITLFVRDDYVFRPDRFTVAPGPVRLTLTSEAEQLTHNIRFTPGAGPAEIAEEIPVLGPGRSETMEFAVDQPGDYQYECSFHVALGQIGMMTVTPA
jgi:plastocyanin